MIAQVMRRLQNLVAWGQTGTPVQDDGATPTVQVDLSSLETKDGLQVIGQFGFSSSTPKGSRVVVLFGAGDRSKGTVIGTVNPGTRRKGLLEGETVVFDNWGNEVHLSQAGVTVKHSTLVTIETPTTKIKGALRVEGPITSTEEVTANCDGEYSTLSQHKHPANGLPPIPGT